MTQDQFWNLIGKTHVESDGVMDMKCKLLDLELRRLGLDEVRSFHEHFYDCMDRVYTWNLWTAAYIIGGGCSDDKFSDFRSTLISMGRDTFENALENPEWLATISYPAEVADYEGFQYVPTTVERELSGGQNLPRSKPHPLKPTGEDWAEERVAEMYPLLAARYRY